MEDSFTKQNTCTINLDSVKEMIWMKEGMGVGAREEGSKGVFPMLQEKHERETHSVMSNSLRPHGLYRPWNSPGPEYWSG